jgi:hypothetical protein
MFGPKLDPVASQTVAVVSLVKSLQLLALQLGSLFTPDGGTHAVASSLDHSILATPSTLEKVSRCGVVLHFRHFLFFRPQRTDFFRIDPK